MSCIRPYTYDFDSSLEDAARHNGRAWFFPDAVIDGGIPVGSISTDQIVASMTDQDIRKYLIFL